jgi:hypothetical protein
LYWYFLLQNVEMKMISITVTVRSAVLCMGTMGSCAVVPRANEPHNNLCMLYTAWFLMLGLYHAMYSRYMFMRCKWWMTYGQGRLISNIGPGQNSALSPLSIHIFLVLVVHIEYINILYVKAETCLMEAVPISFF